MSFSAQIIVETFYQWACYPTRVEMALRWVLGQCQLKFSSNQRSKVLGSSCLGLVLELELELRFGLGWN